MKKIADMMKSEFLENKDLKGIIVGGPGHTKNTFVDGGYITDQLKKKIIALKDLSYTGEFGLQELLDKSEDILSQEDVMEEKKLMQVFFDRDKRHFMGIRQTFGRSPQELRTDIQDVGLFIE